MRRASWEIDSKYKGMVLRYEHETDADEKIQMKYKFIDWYQVNEYRLTDAEREYLQLHICPVIDD